MPQTTTETGAKAERLVREYLEARGFRFLYQNDRSGKYEIDLVMEDGAYLVFVEVKARKSSRYGTPAAFVTPKKQARIIEAASAYLAEYACTERFVRFDVAEVYLCDGTVRHLPDAFRA